jgi:hypothetical protein
MTGQLNLEDQIVGRDLIAKGLSCLNSREEEVLVRRVMFSETYRAVAEDYGVSRERIRQIERRAMRKIRGRLRNRHHIHIGTAECELPRPTADCADEVAAEPVELPYKYVGECVNGPYHGRVGRYDSDAVDIEYLFEWPDPVDGHRRRSRLSGSYKWHSDRWFFQANDVVELDVQEQSL